MNTNKKKNLYENIFANEQVTPIKLPSFNGKTPTEWADGYYEVRISGIKDVISKYTK